MRERKLRNGVYWQGALQQGGIRQTGIKQWLDVLESKTDTQHQHGK
jgi:hypothetical protein